MLSVNRNGFPARDADTCAHFICRTFHHETLDIQDRSDHDVAALCAKKMSAQGIEIVGGSSESAHVFINKQIDTWAKVVKGNGIKAD